MKKFFQKISQTITGIIIILAITLIANAFAEPTQAPPGGNVSAPLNTSATTQTKTGKLLFTWFEDYDNPGYFVDPGGNSTFSRIYTTGTDLSARFAGPVEANAGVWVDGYTAISDGDVWHNTYGNGGWYNGTYAGGWNMEDTTWVRSYNNKSVYTGGQMRADAGFCIGGSCLTSWPSAAAETDPQVGAVTSGKWCIADGAAVQCNQNQPVLSETDPVFNQNKGINVYSCPVIWEGGGQTNCKGQLTADSSCAYDNGTGGWFNYSCSYVGRLIQ